jgi:2-keto-4-pentenoate hydratase
VSDIELAVARLRQAREGHSAPSAPELADAAAGYAAQEQLARELGWFGDSPPQFWKSGGPSREAVAFHAALPPAGVWSSPAHAGAWPFTLRGIEAEVALCLGEPVDAQRAATLDLEGARLLVDAMCVSIEIVDSRWAERLQANRLAKLADVLSHGALVLGPWVAFDAHRDWSDQVCRVRIGSQAAQVFRGTHPAADPVFVLSAWLRHATRHGAVVPAGSVVTTGTWCGLLHAQPGDEVEVAFERIGQASVQL